MYFAHHLLAYVEMLERDGERLRDCLHRLNVCPLGAGALAGSTLPLDRAFVARLLQFLDRQGEARLSQNSMDAVSDRDFVVEFCAAAALLAVHLSRLAEDLVLWAGAEFNFIQIDDAYTTGSSLMPQKKNPDLAELSRGKAGRVVRAGVQRVRRHDGDASGEIYLFHNTGRIRNIHFSDYGHGREHLLPGHGILPLTRFLNHLRSTDYNDTVTLELSPHEFPRDDQIITESLREILAYLRKETAKAA